MKTKENFPIMKLLAACIEAAEIGAKTIREIHSGGHKLAQVDKGGPMNVQTEADRACERIMKATLLSKFPQVNILPKANVFVKKLFYVFYGLNKNHVAVSI